MTEDYPSDAGVVLYSRVPATRAPAGGIMAHALDSVLEPFRPGFDADGFDVTVDSVHGDGTAVVRIYHRANACEECLIPDDMLTGILTTALKRAAPDVTGVVIQHEHA
jgi:Fe-S cluster biogenesis protein NfuA